MKNFFQNFCPRRSTFNVEGCAPGMYYKPHAENCMVGVMHRRRLHLSFHQAADFQCHNASYCDKQYMEGLVVVRSRRYLHNSFTMHWSFNVEGSNKVAYCKQHTDDGMVNVINRCCLHSSCIKRPNFDDKGSEQASYCTQLAKNGMVNVVSRHCPHDSCIFARRFNVE